MIQDARDIADFIASSYKGKIVEVGVGRRPEVALLLKDHLEIVVTDIEDHTCPGIRFVRDDIFHPNLDTYQEASLIYSIRPPIDIQPAIAEVAAKVGADLLIRPFAQEKTELERYFKEGILISHGRARFYLYKKPKSQINKE